MNILNTPLWNSLLLDPSQTREAKPRNTGMTMLIDKGIGPLVFEEILSYATPYIDFIKLGFGTAVLYPVETLKQKIALAKAAGITLYPGGTFFEIAYLNGLFSEYLVSLEEFGFSCLEISDGTISLSVGERRRIIKECRQRGFTVLAECGKKASGSHLTIDELERTLYSDIDCGASYVIVEGRESGANVGIYNSEGEPDYEFLTAIRRIIGPEVRDRLIWEAPQKNQQIDFIHFFGRNVNLGNIQTDDIYPLECLRRGLRSDTLLMPSGNSTSKSALSS
ncbi:phosphosulfolactate synthase [Aneurinibacillus terranovensis]|uniref:phosphosulfolactate synthase n=1 Tax=Aneurinibacillus terranovensis TaxID=278991 RepID=UPI000408B5B6|nr:phosphosulfolactate synthase [Aneurinibacillus terranovensis]